LADLTSTFSICCAEWSRIRFWALTFANGKNRPFSDIWRRRMRALKLTEAAIQGAVMVEIDGRNRILVPNRRPSLLSDET
jgi:hypothetical protein